VLRRRAHAADTRAHLGGGETFACRDVRRSAVVTKEHFFGKGVENQVVSIVPLVEEVSKDVELPILAAKALREIAGNRGSADPCGTQENGGWGGSSR
jgi:hypothetical protein